MSGFFGGGTADDDFRVLSARFRHWARLNQHQQLSPTSVFINWVFSKIIVELLPSHQELILGEGRM